MVKIVSHEGDERGEATFVDLPKDFVRMDLSRSEIVR